MTIKIVKDFFIFFMSILLLSLLTTLLIEKVFYELNLKMPQNHLFNFDRDRDAIKYVVLYCVIGPVFEELAFRLPIKFTRVNSSISIIFLSYYFFSFLFKTHLYVFSTANFIPILLSINLGIIISYLLKNEKIYDLFFNIFNSTKSWIIILLYSILFAIPHLLNYKLVNINKIYTILLIFPEMISGILFCISRLKYNIIFSILLHMSINLLGFSPILLSK